MESLSNSTLFSIEQVGLLIGKSPDAVKKYIKRHKITKIVSYDKREALKNNLPWKQGGGGGNRGKRPFVSILDPIIPQDFRFKFYEEKIAADNDLNQRNNSTPAPSLSYTEIKDYSILPAFKRDAINYRLAILRSTDALRGEGLKQWLHVYNQQNPEKRPLTYETVLSWRRLEKEYGCSALAPDYGKNAGRSCVPAELLQFYEKLYLKEGAPSAYSCRILTLGYAKEIGVYDLLNFPSARSFERAVIAGIGKEAAYLARHGKQKWNRKYADYISRNYDKVRAGECYVSDHHQLDLMVKLPNGTYARPWVTVWRDFKSGKWLSWLLHIEAPNADHIFQTLFDAILNFGVPAEIVIDNGKDYRCHDLRGNKTTHRVTVDEKRTSGLFAALGILVHYCLPYRAQSKPIERDFRTIIEGFCKHQLLYTGGNPQEKPECTEKDKKEGKGISLEELISLFDTYVLQIFNQLPSQNSKILNGMCRDELFKKDRITPRYVNPDSLMLLCSRTSKPLTIGRNGAWDGANKVFYWGEFMANRKGDKVYLRRDIHHFEEAWVFDLRDEFIGKACLVQSIPALAKTAVEKAQLSAAMKEQRARAKATKKLAEVVNRPTAEETIEYMRAGVAVLNQLRGYDASSGKEVEGISMLSPADGVIKQAAEMDARGTQSLAALAPEKPKPKTKIFAYEFEKREYELSQKEKR